jgi:site-specific recombinase XerD
MKKYETLWGLDDTKINYVYETLKNYQKSLQDYQSQLLALQSKNQTVNPDMVKSYLQQLTDKTSQTLQSYLGQESFDRLQRNRVIQFGQLSLLSKP